MLTVNQVRKKVKTLIQATFDVDLKDDRAKEIFKFSIRAASFTDLGYEDRKFLDFEKEQAIWNTCHKRKVDCVAFFNEVREISAEGKVILSSSMHSDPARMSSEQIQRTGVL